MTKRIVQTMTSCGFALAFLNLGAPALQNVIRTPDVNPAITLPSAKIDTIRHEHTRLKQINKQDLTRLLQTLPKPAKESGRFRYNIRTAQTSV